MRIALSCTGEGFGHAARTVALARVLSRKYELVIFCPRRLNQFMRDNLGDVELQPIPYFSFVKKRERILLAATAVANLGNLLRFPTDVTRLSRTLKRLGIQAVISDYDPYLPYAADRLAMPILQINHPSVVLRDRSFSIESMLARLISIMLMGKYHRKLIVSFYDGDVGPIVRPELEEHPRGKEDFFVVYLKPSYRKIMLKKLRKLAVNNVELFPDPNKNIVDYLSRCKGVISSAGHQFMSEAMVLGKPVFVVPQTGQYEQMLNARMLELSGWGTYSTIEQLDQRLPEFIRSVDSYPKTALANGVRYSFKNDLNRAVSKIEQFLQSAQQSPPERVAQYRR
ncbi:MAG: glycosyltransferase family protein [Alkalispirochaetaceae bacterium]